LNLIADNCARDVLFRNHVRLSIAEIFTMHAD